MTHPRVDPACETCWSVATMTRGRLLKCRWCAGDDPGESYAARHARKRGSDKLLAPAHMAATSARDGRRKAARDKLSDDALTRLRGSPPKRSETIVPHKKAAGGRR